MGVFLIDQASRDASANGGSISVKNSRTGLYLMLAPQVHR